MTIKVGPRPKLRVTVRSSTPPLPHAGQTDWELDTVDRDDEECASKAELDDRFGFDTVKRETTDDELDFARLSVALARDDFAREENAFEVKDREVVIVKVSRGMKRHRIVLGALTQSRVRLIVRATRIL